MRVTEGVSKASTRIVYLLIVLSLPCAVRARRHADVRAKDLREVGKAFEADEHGDLGDRALRAQKQRL